MDKDFWQDVARLQREDMARRVQYQQEFSVAALKSLMLANGGAIIALLTFIGNYGTVQADAIRRAMLCYGIGLFLGLLTYLGAYLSQGSAMTASNELARASARIASVPDLSPSPPPDWVADTWKTAGRSAIRRANGWIALSLGLALASLGLFGAGCWFALGDIV